MSGFEWFLLVVVVILVPLIVAVAITLWTLEMARQRKRQNRAPVDSNGGPVKRKATRESSVSDETVTSPTGGGIGASQAAVGSAVVVESTASVSEDDLPRGGGDDIGTPESSSDSGASDGGSSDNGSSSGGDSGSSHT